ncbi:MAG: 50S ribosomal protein L3 N(5)-glutamine methyltransferase [Pseudomonadota bacterium]
MTQRLTLESLIRASARRLDDAGVWCGHGTDNVLDEATWLALHALGLPPDQPPDYARVRSEADAAAVRSLVTARITRRVPAAYLTGTAWFAGHAFKSDARALVPRSPIAELIQARYRPWIVPERVHRVLDLCTGGGCIAIATAHALPEATVHGTDLSADALALAAENVALHGLDARVRLFEGDVFAPVAGERYDLIVSNPPYVDAREIAEMPAEYHAEPALGLASGADGLDLTRRILREAGAHLSDAGVLIVEVGASMPAATAAFAHLPLQWVAFEHGGDGVFAVTASELRAASGG